VLGRTVVLRGSSGSLNIGSCSFHLVAARETRVAVWCKGEHMFSVIQVGACVTGSLCCHPVGAGTLGELVLPSSGC
jgi:phosphatidylserine decarboxylase